MGFAEWMICCPSQSLPIHVFRDVKRKAADTRKDCGCRGDPYPSSMHAEGSLCRIGSGLHFHLTYLGIM